MALAYLSGAVRHPDARAAHVTVVVVLAWLGFAAAVRERVTRPLQTLSNMLAALREGDYSIRARGALRPRARSGSRSTR